MLGFRFFTIHSECANFAFLRLWSCPNHPNGERESIIGPELSHLRRQSGPASTKRQRRELGGRGPCPRRPKRVRPSNKMGRKGASHQPASDDDASRRNWMVASGGGGRARNHHPSSTHPTGVVPGRAACSRRRCGAGLLHGRREPRARPGRTHSHAH